MNVIDLAFAAHYTQKLSDGIDNGRTKGGISSNALPPMPSSPPPPPPPLPSFPSSSSSSSSSPFLLKPQRGEKQLLVPFDDTSASSGVPNVIAFHTPPRPAPSARKGTMDDTYKSKSDQKSSSSSSSSSPSAPPSHSGVALVPFGAAQQQQENKDVDPDLARIIASQQRIMDLAKQQKKSSTRSNNQAIVPYEKTNSSGNGINRSQQQLALTRSPDKSNSAASAASVDTGLHPQRKQMKQERKAKTATGTIGGAIVGGLALGPAGVILGGAAGGLVTRKICKAGEKRAQRKFEQRNVQKVALKSATARSAAFA